MVFNNENNPFDKDNNSSRFKLKAVNINFLFANNKFFLYYTLLSPALSYLISLFIRGIFNFRVNFSLSRYDLIDILMAYCRQKIFDG